MQTPVNFDQIGEDRIVYIRPVDVAELPDDIRSQAGPAKQIYAVHDANGERLALVQNRRLAFHLARENQFAPVNVH
ncbi:MAG: DUF1150 family protein [Rhodobacteraceae bacterium]|nr:DUF1150 family protein [Paracoccaceae bacterium]